MKYAVDTGAVLSLACSLHFQFLVEKYSLITTKEVMKELEVFAQYHDFLGRKAQIANKKIQEKTIIIEKPQTLLLLKIEPAELSVFSLGKEKKYEILTDDIHAARIAEQQLKLLTKPSFSLLFQLYKEKKITKQELMNDLEEIGKQRHWMTGVLYRYVKEQIERL